MKKQLKALSTANNVVPYTTGDPQRSDGVRILMRQSSFGNTRGITIYLAGSFDLMADQCVLVFKSVNHADLNTCSFIYIWQLSGLRSDPNTDTHNVNVKNDNMEIFYSNSR